jgi:hypothetical protein
MRRVQFGGTGVELQELRAPTQALSLGESGAAQAERLLGCDADSKTLAAFRPSPLDDQTAIFGSHANEEAVGSFTGDFAGLESSFHLYRLLKRVLLCLDRKGSMRLKHNGKTLSRAFSETNICLAK